MTSYQNKMKCMWKRGETGVWFSEKKKIKRIVKQYLGFSMLCSMKMYGKKFYVFLKVNCNY